MNQTKEDVGKLSTNAIPCRYSLISSMLVRPSTTKTWPNKHECRTAWTANNQGMAQGFPACNLVLAVENAQARLQITEEELVGVVGCFEPPPRRIQDRRHCPRRHKTLHALNCSVISYALPPDTSSQVSFIHTSRYMLDGNLRSGLFRHWWDGSFQSKNDVIEPMCGSSFGCLCTDYYYTLRLLSVSNQIYAVQPSSENCNKSPEPRQQRGLQNGQEPD